MKVLYEIIMTVSIVCLLDSGKIPCPYPGRIWLEQRGFQRSMYWHIEARVVLDLQEFINSVSISSVNTSKELFVLL